VELLVVVAVIALLIAVLLPALSGARRSAMGLVSLSRMRQVATGWAMYAYDADDTCVPGQPGRFGDDDLNVYNVGNGPHYRPRWFAAMGAKAGFFAYYVPSEIRDDEHTYQVNNEVFLCPVVPEWTSTRNHPYGYNYQFLGNARFAADDESEGFINYPVKSSMLRTFSETVMFASCMGTAGGKPESARTPNLADGSRQPGPDRAGRPRVRARPAPDRAGRGLRRPQKPLAPAPVGAGRAVPGTRPRRLVRRVRPGGPRRGAGLPGPRGRLVRRRRSGGDQPVLLRDRAGRVRADGGRDAARAVARVGVRGCTTAGGP
jgi:hypothetical protein